MKPSRRKFLGLVILFVLFLPLAISVAEAFREGRQQAANRALIAAVKKNDTALVISLLSEGADPNARDLLPDYRPAWKRIWDNLRQKNVSFAYTPTALLVALVMNADMGFPPENVPLVKALLDAGASANVAEPDGTTPLMWAVMSRKRETVRLLLDRGADINAISSDGFTALQCAAPGFDPSLLKLLLARGALVNMRPHVGTTALHAAAISGRMASVRLLLENGAEVNSRDTDGNTPLLDAAMGNHADCVKLLLAKGAQANTVDNQGDTPLSWAHNNKNTQIIKMLKDAGAKK